MKQSNTGEQGAAKESTSGAECAASLTGTACAGPTTLHTASGSGTTSQSVCMSSTTSTLATTLPAVAWSSMAATWLMQRRRWLASCTGASGLQEEEAQARPGIQLKCHDCGPVEMAHGVS